MKSLELKPLIHVLNELETRSCLIEQQGNMIMDYYREPQIANELYKINSCTKSVISALVSMAMDQRLVPKPETPILEFFPQLAKDSDPRKRDITIEHLLTMSAGFNWTEFGGQNSFPTMSKTSDWVHFVLSQPLSHLPGTRMEYSSGCSQLLATLLRSASGQAVAEFAEEQLFQPLGIDNYHWETDPQGTHTGGFGLHLRPLDMLKFGRLYLNEGSWEGRQIIQTESVRYSTRPFLPASKPQKAYYGCHWWASSFSDEETGTEIDYFYALGFGGQYIIVVPSYDLVVVLTADTFKKKRTPVDIFRQYLVPLLLQ
ncbi:serine hydrolase domain-containing protein [Paenibacillus polymyxa]|uniref:serine hydrolase domain-containing protein n=1 Tax=Paenibacillus polymyxa TaxID=1406 RepID=UPI0018670D57|nr:serine hydrolase [Paenibacillus polymyxa]MBE3648079.1 serine hydrolase [Paenibacillus polymyxa]